MGMLMSFMGMGLPSSQMFNMLMSTLYKQFAEKEIDNFEDFHQAFLDIFNTVNSALPGKHYDVPSRKDVEECYNKWGGYPEEKIKIEFEKFMKKTMKLSSLDDVTIKTGIMTPPAAMAIKKAGQNVPQMKMIKAIPDVIFVPSITLIALISAKLSRKIIQRKSTPHPQMEAAAPPASRPPSPQPNFRKEVPHSPQPNCLEEVPHSPNFVDSVFYSPQPNFQEEVPQKQAHLPPSYVASKPAEAPLPRHPRSTLYQPSYPKESSTMTWYSPPASRPPSPQPNFREEAPQKHLPSSYPHGDPHFWGGNEFQFDYPASA